MITRKTAMKQLRFLKKHSNDMRLAADFWENDWQVLIAILLSARTLDETVIRVCTPMFKKYPTPEKFSKLKLNEVKKLIGSVNFYNNKSKMILSTSKKIVDEFNEEVPRDLNKLITLSGVGRKTANVFLGVNGGANIGVDTHVTYMSNYLGWTKSIKPEVIEKDLEKLFPKNKWNTIGHTLIRFGKTHLSKKVKNMILDEARKIR